MTDEAKIEASKELAYDIVFAMQKFVQRCGDDQNLAKLIAAGVYGPIVALDEQAPGFKALVIQMLQET